MVLLSFFEVPYSSAVFVSFQGRHGVLVKNKIFQVSWSGTEIQGTI